MAEHKAEQPNRVIVFDMDGVINNPNKQEVGELKGMSMRMGTPSAGFITNKYEAKGNGIGVPYVELLTCFFNILEKYKVKSVVGTQRLLALLGEDRQEKESIEDFLDVLDSAFGEERTFLRREDAIEMAKALKQKEKTDVSYDLLVRGKSKRILLKDAQERFGAPTFLVDDTPVMFLDARDQGFHDSIYVNKNEGYYPFFIIDVLLKVLTLDQIKQEIAEMSTENRKNFITLLRLHKEIRRVPPSSFLSPAAYATAKAVFDLDQEKDQARNRLIQHLALESPLALEQPLALEPPPASEPPLYRKLFRAALFLPISLIEFVLRLWKPTSRFGKGVFSAAVLIFWPEKQLERFPEDGSQSRTAFRILLRVASIVLLTTIIMFVFPPLAAALAGAFGASLNLSFLPTGFEALEFVGIGAAQVFFGIIGFAYAVSRQIFPPDDSLLTLPGKGDKNDVGSENLSLSDDKREKPGSQRDLSQDLGAGLAPGAGKQEVSEIKGRREGESQYPASVGSPLYTGGALGVPSEEERERKGDGSKADDSEDFSIDLDDDGAAKELTKAEIAAKVQLVGRGRSGSGAGIFDRSASQQGIGGAPENVDGISSVDKLRAPTVVLPVDGEEVTLS